MIAKRAAARVGLGGFFIRARGRRQADRNAGDGPAHLLIPSAPSRGLDRMFAEIDSGIAAGTRAIANRAAITAEYGVTLAPRAR